MMRSSSRIFITFLALLMPAIADPVRYGTEVRPILAHHCFQCHGPDAQERKADMRLDIPGEADLNAVRERIASVDPDTVMPPPEANKVLGPEQIEILSRWIDEGAPYEKHWAFVAPERARPPDNGHPIDSFVREGLHRQGLTPSPPADRRTLLRRLYLDLIGMAPTPRETDRFLADRSVNAYERLVDRLLQSPQYGERWARRWLDLARYADTNGYEKDRDRSIWPYRDWVVRAINRDLPFDQFTVEQLAGDLLPDSAPDQLIATGFHRNTMLNEEGGIDPLEFRFHAVADRVATTGTAFLGLTLGCAQCHTHKYDPITHTEYYAFFAYLNNADEPDYVIPDPARDAEHQANVKEAERRLETLAESPKALDTLEGGFDSWLEEMRAKAAAWTPLAPEAWSSNLPLLTPEGDGIVFVSGDISKHDVYQLRYRTSLPTAALRLEALPDPRLPAGGPGMTYYEGTKGDFYLTEFSVRVDGEPVGLTGAMESYANNRFGDRPVGAAMTLDGDVQTGWSVHGRIGKRHLAIFKLETPLEAGRVFEVEMHFGRHFASSLGKFRLSATSDTNPGLLANPVAPLEPLLVREPSTWSEAERGKVEETFLLSAPEFEKEAERIRQLQRMPDGVSTLIMRERPPENPRPTYRHHRGEFLQPQERVSPGLPAALVADVVEIPQDRLGLARWLVSRENPLTARVVANRQWAAFFGEGIVPTLGDFGLQGQLPTHPELLDWLAVEFMDGGWSRKKLHRLIVTSETYRQSSLHRDEDPENRWLARSPRLRLEAEIIRDSFLRAAGLWVSEMHGPPVRPPQPEGVTEVAYGNPKWNASEGAERFRRSLYTYQKRTAPFAMFASFDAPSGEACVARRDDSNTPLQALTLMNDPMLVEVSQALGASLAESDEEPRQTLARAFRRVLNRNPSDAELETLEQFHRRQWRRLEGGEWNATAIAGGDGDEAKRRAGWTAVARVLFSLDETITRN